MSNSSHHLDGYHSACEAHPELKSFDSGLQQRTMKVIDLVTTGGETGTYSSHEIHMEVTKNLVEVTKDVSDFILSSEVDVWENIPIRSLVKAYFENTVKTLQIFDNIMDCVERAELGQLVIQAAVEQFAKESEGKGPKKFEKTLKYLKKFKALGDPFAGEELKTQFKLIKEQQESLLNEVSETKKKIEEELERNAAEEAHKKKWSFWSNVIFGVTAFAVGIASIALIATGVGVIAGVALAGVLVLGIVPAWIGVQTVLNNKIKDLEKKQEELRKMYDALSAEEKAIETNKEALVSVSELVDGAEKKISSIMTDVDDALEEEDVLDIQIAMTDVKDKVVKTTEKLQELGESVDNYNKLIREARLHVLEKINSV